MTQRERVFDYLQRNGSMTTPETVVNRFGEPCRIVRYSL